MCRSFAALHLQKYMHVRRRESLHVCFMKLQGCRERDTRQSVPSSGSWGEQPHRETGGKENMSSVFVVRKKCSSVD